MIGWKQGYTLGRENIVLIKPQIPDNADVCLVKKLRTGRSFLITDRAIPLSITSVDGKHEVRRAVSLKDPSFIYEVGTECFAETDVSIGNMAGIYFFKTRKDAAEYEY